MRLPLIKVASQSDVPVGEGENGLGLRQGVEVEFHLVDAPFFDREGRMFDHRQAPDAVLSETMMSAVWCLASIRPGRLRPMKKSAVLFGK